MINYWKTILGNAVGEPFRSHHLKSFLPRLKLDEQQIFAGLDQASQEKGQIYKRRDAEGRYTFFQAEGFGAEFYHYLFSKRLSQSDLFDVNQQVVRWLKNSDDFSSKLRVEATFDRIFHQIHQIHKNHDLELEKAENLIFKEPHIGIFESIARKIHAIEETSVTEQQKDNKLNQEEISILYELSEMSETSLHPYLQEAIHRLKEGTHPVKMALENLDALESIAIDLRVLREKAQESQLNEEEVERILLAKAKLAELQDRWGRYLDIKSFRASYQGLDQLFELAEIQGEQITQSLANQAIMEKLIQKNPWIFAFASHHLKENFAFAVLMLTRYSNHFVIVKEVMQHFGELLALASEDLRDHPEIVRFAVANKARAFEFASKRIQNSDLDIAKLALQQTNTRPELVKFILKYNGLALQYASEKYRNDTEFVLLAISQNIEALKFVPEHVKKEIISKKLSPYLSS